MPRPKTSASMHGHGHALSPFRTGNISTVTTGFTQQRERRKSIGPGFLKGKFNALTSRLSNRDNTDSKSANDEYEYEDEDEGM